MPLPSRPRVPAVFLDKDGTLIENVPYNVDPALVRLAPGSAEALPRLHVAGYRVVVVSNQSGVARGYFPEEALAAVEDRLCALLGALGVPLAGFYYCPHHPEGCVPAYRTACECRKPAPGLVLRAADELNVDLARSWLIGDLPDDVEAGRRAGCRTVLIARTDQTARELERRWGPVAADLAGAAQIVLSGTSAEVPPGAGELPEAGPLRSG